MNLLIWLARTGLGMVLLISAVGAWAGFDEDFEDKRWSELTVQLPPPPKKESLQEFYVSPIAEHVFLVDLNTLAVGSDGVVRYTLVIRTSGGATNISYEGMRCKTREVRLYAFGQHDGSWSKAKNNDWTKIRDGGANRYHAALFTDHFCPAGVIVASVPEARRILRQGGEKLIAIPSK